MENDKLLFDSLEHENLRTLKDVPALVEIALKYTDRRPRDIGAIIVGQGPGGTSSIRSGVSFANSLAYSLKIPVAAVNAFELMGASAEVRFECPVLITVKSIRGNAYGGWFSGGQLQQTIYGPMEEVVRSLVDTTATFAVAGAHREFVLDLFPQRTVHDTGRKFGLASNLPMFLPEFSKRQMVFPQYVLPLTEQSELFDKVPS